MVANLFNFTEEFEDLSRSEVDDNSEDADVHKMADVGEEPPYTDLFEQARQIYSRGSRRYTRRAARII